MKTEPPAPAPSLLAAEDLHRTYRVRGRPLHALRGVSLGLTRGRTTALVGESGSGKSTLARVLVCLERPQRGRVLLDGRRIDDLPQRKLASLRRRVQMVFQDPYDSLNPRLRVRSIVGEPLAVHGLGTRGQRKAKVADLLAQVGLSGDAAERFPHEFSGGQRQRISLARALAVQPELIIADEPVSALDVSVQAQVINLMMDLQQRHGLAYLLVAHDLPLVEHMADDVAVMYLGRLVERGPAEPVFERPLHPYTQALLASAPSLDPAAARATRLPGEPPSPFDLPGGCAFHPRCPRAVPRCGAEVPASVEREPGRWVACHLAEARSMVERSAGSAAVADAQSGPPTGRA